MISEIIIPNMGANIEEGTIIEWYVEEDDMVYLGDALFCYETTKGTFDIEAEQDGIILKILHPDGVHKPLSVVGYIGEEGDEMP
jgi:pyruvate/2-oxoglutarate dehydrogenase complex dihydrolipoamide acyltransferase (E2) component